MKGRKMPQQRCVLCGQEAQEKYKPFCSRRCADVDLNRWLSESYRIPVQDEDFSPDLTQAEEGDKTRH